MDEKENLIPEELRGVFGIEFDDVMKARDEFWRKTLEQGYPAWIEVKE